LLSKTWNKNYKRVKHSIGTALKKNATCESVKDYVQSVRSSSSGNSNESNNCDNFTYFHAKKVFELYLAYCTEDSNERVISKSLFNNYKDEDLSTWDNITHAYKKNNLYMGEAARVMKQNMVYEIPAMRQNIARIDKRIGDIDRKISEYEKSITESKQTLIIKCKELKIKGVNYRPELLARAAELVPALNKIQKDIQEGDLQNACDFFVIFSNYIFDPTSSTVESKENRKNVTFNAIFKLIDGAIVESNNSSGNHEISMGDVGGDIDWGNMMNQLDGKDVVSNDTPAIIDADGVGIDWSSMLETTSGDPATTTANDANSGNNEIEIDWSSMVEIEAEGTTVEYSNENSNPLSLSDFRQAIINELLQLKTFYNHRIFEMSDESENSNSLLTSGDNGLPALIRNSNIDTMTRYFNSVTKIMDAMKDPKIQQLLAIHSGGGAFDRIVNGLQAIDLQISKLEKLKEKILDERSILSQETRDCRSNLERLAKDTIELKTNIENALSKHYNGRNVKIVGDINSL
jgi:hypothetical protein